MNSSLPWKAVAGLRHRLVHDYDGTNCEIIAEVLFTEMGPFVQGVAGLIGKMQDNGDK